jgi:hypothetical protein
MYHTYPYFNFDASWVGGLKAPDLKHPTSVQKRYNQKCS